MNEPETGWEAFISDRPGQEARNRGIALNAYERLSGQLSAPAPVSVNLDGMRLRLDVGGKQIEGVIRQEAGAVVHAYDQSQSRAATRGVRRF